MSDALLIVFAVLYIAVSSAVYVVARRDDDEAMFVISFVMWPGMIPAILVIEPFSAVKRRLEIDQEQGQRRRQK